MILIQLILLQFSAHLLADYIFQPQKWSDRKSQKTITVYHVYHALVIFGCSWLCSLDYGFWKAALILTLLHLLIDVLKSYFSNKYKEHPSEKYIFFIDQSIHILILILVTIAYSCFGEINFEWDIPLKKIAIITGFILIAKPTNILIKNIFILYAISTPLVTDKSATDSSLPNAGKLIGVVERFLAFALVLSGQYAAVGFIIAAKSILRFNATDKNEYVLVGTLLSFGMAVLTGIIIMQI